VCLASDAVYTSYRYLLDVVTNSASTVSWPPRLGGSTYPSHSLQCDVLLSGHFGRAFVLRMFHTKRVQIRRESRTPWRQTVVSGGVELLASLVLSNQRLALWWASNDRCSRVFIRLVSTNYDRLAADRSSQVRQSQRRRDRLACTASCCSSTLIASSIQRNDVKTDASRIASDVGCVDQCVYWPIHSRCSWVSLFLYRRPIHKPIYRPKTYTCIWCVLFATLVTRRIGR